MKKVSLIFIPLILLASCVRPRFDNVNNIKVDELGFEQKTINLNPEKWILYVRTVVLDSFKVQKVLKNNKVDSLNPPSDRLTPNDITQSHSANPIIIEQQYLFINDSSNECLIINNIPDTKARMYNEAKKNKRQEFYREQRIKKLNKNTNRLNTMKNQVSTNQAHASWLDSSIQIFNIDVFYFNQFRYGKTSDKIAEKKQDTITLRFYDVQPYGTDHDWKLKKDNNSNTLFMFAFDEVNKHGVSSRLIEKSYSLPLVFIKEKSYQLIYLDKRKNDKSIDFPIHAEFKLYRKKQKWFSAFQFRPVGDSSANEKVPVGMDEYLLFGKKTMYAEPSMRNF